MRLFLLLPFSVAVERAWGKPAEAEPEQIQAATSALATDSVVKVDQEQVERDGADSR